MEEKKYHERFHQANMSHLLSIFNKSKNIMLVMVLSRIVFEQNVYAALGIFIGYMIMVACTNRLEQSNISNNQSVLIMAHFITIIKVVTCISATIRKNPEPPSGLQTGVVIWFILTLEAMKAIEPDYVKAIKMFSLYWTFYLASLCLYYQTVMVEQIVTFASLFWLIYEIYKEKYELSNSLTEIFYDFYNDPIVIYEDESSIKANIEFLSYFGKAAKRAEIRHHSQMLTEITNPDDIMLEFHQGKNIERLSLLQIIRRQKEINKKELVLRKEGGDKILMFTFKKLENIYNDKTVCIFKDTTHIHQLQKVKSQVEFRSVIMGCLTHELRTPVNWVISILKTLQDYIEDSDEARKLLTICQGTIEMLRSLTEDFIDFTRFENEKGLPVKKEFVNIKEFFNEISNIFSFQAEEKDLRFDINMTTEIPNTIYTDPKRLKQVILNLLSNSFKFTQRGKIEINLLIKKGVIEKQVNHFTDETDFNGGKSLLRGALIDSTKSVKDDYGLLGSFEQHKYFTEEEDQKRYLIIEVVDTGLGMDEKDRKELFTKFGTGKNSRGLNTNGLGLGLYLSKEICLKLGGDINWESISGIGSTFIIKLPFDSKYEVKELLENENLLLKSPKNGNKPDFSTAHDDDFKEFFDTETKDSVLAGLHKNYDFRLSRNCFKIFQSLSRSRSNNESNSSVDKSIVKDSKKETKLDKRNTDSRFELDLVKTCNCKKVLVVDDLAFNLLAVELMLKKKFNIIPDKAFSGNESIIKVKQKLMSPCCKSYSLILMDYYMPPGINGAEASLKIKQILKHNHQKSHIAWLTSQREGDFAFNKSLKNFDNFYSKPIHPEDIKELIEQLFEVK